MSLPSALPGSPIQSRAGHVWGEVWRVLVAATLSVIGFTVPVVWSDPRGPGGQWPEMDFGGAFTRPSFGPLMLDAALGITSLGLLLLRRRAPLAITLVLTAFTAVGGGSTGAWVISMTSLATHRRWRHIAVVPVPLLAASISYRLFSPLSPETKPDQLLPVLATDAITDTMTAALLAAIGAFIGARRDLLRSLHERAVTAELEQARRTVQARVNERQRIAREMHDVLAHRMSLVAMHAGALAYRENLSPDEVREVAAVIQESAHQALEELREVLGVLRDASAADQPDRPQPTLDALGELVEQARGAGTDVRLTGDLTVSGSLQQVVSRSAYRILQEALTNARKHAPGSRVHIEVSGSEGDGLTLRVANPVPAVAASDPATSMPSSGLGLAGLTERAELAGGTLSFGERSGQFVVTAWLPWTQ